ncbi:MAG: VPGUxxT family thioredoxin-like (seleno)protein, type 2 [Myxococcota bacterium]
MLTNALFASTLLLSSAAPELGTVDWMRDYDDARARAQREGKPLLVLFDEVPGCSTVKAYGAKVLSHPLIEEAMENLFVSVAVFNNVEGEDRRILKRFEEPTWNNPVLRVLDPSNESALADRLYGDYSVAATARTMRDALVRSNRPVPEYLSLLAHGSDTQVATYQMYCFWSGEVALGGVEGVVETEPGFSSGEVVRVEYDPKRVSVNELDRVADRANAKRVTNKWFSGSAKDNKYQLAHSLLRFVPMTESQSSRVNAALGRRSNPLSFLSPRQIAMYSAVKARNGEGWRTAIGSDFVASYRAAERKLGEALVTR